MIRHIVLLALMCVAPCAALAQTETSPAEPLIEVGETVQSDEAIEQRIQNLLREIDGYDEVSVRVAEGVVILQGEVIDNTARSELAEIVGRVDGVITIENTTAVAGTLEERLTPAVDRLQNRLRSMLSNGPIFIVAAVFFLLIAVGGWLLTTRLPIWTWIAPNRFIADVYRAIARIAFILIGVVVALDILNATALIGAVLGAAGVVGLAVGFAVRDTVENFIASVLLSLRQPFRPNDVIEIDGDIGTVARLTSRATILISPEGNHIRIPNATVYKGKIVNYTRDPERRFQFVLGVDADSDLARALQTATDAIRDLPFVLNDPEVGAWVSEVGDSNVLLTFTGWVDQTSTDFLKARGEAIRTAKTALETAGFGLPEPIYRVRVDGNVPAIAKTIEEDEPTTLTVQESELPAAADPGQIVDAPSEAAARERAASDGGTDLLSEAQKGE